MSSSKTKDYVVEKILSKRTNGKGRTFYLIKWRGYSATDNSWEPENHVLNCQDMIKEFEAEQAKKNKSKDSNSNASEQRTSQRSTRSGASPSKKSTNKNERSIRMSNRSSLTRQPRKRASSNDSIFTDDDNDNDIDDDYTEKKLIKSLSSKRSRKSTTDTDSTPSIASRDSDILDTTKLDHILDVRRNKKTNIIEYYIQVKKMKKIWIKSDRLTEDYTQQVIDFLEEKYV